MRLKITLLFLTLICFYNLFAYDFQKDGYSYTILKRTAPFEIALSYGSDYYGEITIPSTVLYHDTLFTVSTIAGSTFYQKSITKVNIPNTVTTIAPLAFEACNGLKSVTIPATVLNIGDVSFMDCQNLVEINVEASNPNYSSQNGVLYNKDFTQLISYPAGLGSSFTVPNTVKIIGHSSFYNCSTLSQITLPNQLEKIEEGAFAKCTHLISISLPSTLSFLDNVSFFECKGLKSIYVHTMTPIDISNKFGVFSSVSATLYVPIGAKPNYVIASGWSDFRDIVEAATAVSSLHKEKMEIKSMNNSIVISSDMIATTVKIFSLSGELVKEQNIDSDKMVITISKGSYIVQAGDYAQKVVVK